MRQRRLQAAQLALQRTIDDDVASVDHRTTNQAGIHGSFDFNFAPETALECALDRLQLGRRQRGFRFASAGAA